MKDRHAITVQWFSLHLAGRPDPDWDSLPDGMTVVESTRHSRKLKTGALAGNRFIIVLRDCLDDPGAVKVHCAITAPGLGAMDFRDAVLRRSDAMRTRGVPNYFGEQRFGHGGGNVAARVRCFPGAGACATASKEASIYRLRAVICSMKWLENACWRELGRGHGRRRDDPECTRSFCAGLSMTPSLRRLAEGRHPSERAALGARGVATRAATRAAGAGSGRMNIRTLHAAGSRPDWTRSGVRCV